MVRSHIFGVEITWLLITKNRLIRKRIRAQDVSSSSFSPPLNTQDYIQVFVTNKAIEMKIKLIIRKFKIESSNEYS